MIDLDKAYNTHQKDIATNAELKAYPFYSAKMQ